jgi:predicted enzyme related to lactoylglutathione lyase
VSKGIKTVIYPVRDVVKARALFATLAGAEPVVESPYYVGFKVGDQDIGLDPNGHSQGMTGPVAYWHVDDIEAALGAIADAGGERRQAPRDVGGGRLIATATDADGNVIGLLQDP